MSTSREILRFTVLTGLCLWVAALATADGKTATASEAAGDTKTTKAAETASPKTVKTTKVVKPAEKSEVTKKTKPTDAAAKSDDALEIIEKSLEFTHREKQLLLKINDSSESVEENGFYMMMQKVSAFPKLPAEELNLLDLVAVRKLMRFPDRYRYQPVRLNIRVYAVTELTVDNRMMSSSPYWPSDKPMYLIHGTNADIKDKASEPVIIYSATPPPDLPAHAVKIDEYRTEYRDYNNIKSPQYTIAAVFYKHKRELDKAKKQVREYPVLLAWQMERKKVALANKSTADNLLKMIGALVALGLIVAFLMVKRHIAKKKRSQRDMTFGDYVPLRDLEEDEEEELEDTAVDPDLTAAAAAYRKEHGMGE
ncbi:MAG: hypothetical protein K8S55_11750 [Phycisphaerae bacterium]|nr:hypothetical protein [Phycisphaerae bacterium]